MTNNKVKTYVFDIDGTICTNTNGAYEKAKPYYERINVINKLFEKGNKIIMFTARGSTTNIDWRELTEQQLDKWKLKYHVLKLKKPFGDFYIDDKAITDNKFFIDSKENNSNISNYSFNFIRILEEFAKDKNIQNKLEKVANNIYKSFLNGGKLIICGNGGSMSDALHISAEFTGRFKDDRRPLPSIVLGSNQSTLSCIANDYSFKKVFSRELEAIGNKKDKLLLISTSGKSENIIDCLKKSKEMGIETFLFTSIKYQNLVDNPDLIIKVNSKETAMIQHMHIFFGHIICEFIEEYVSNES